MKIVFFYAIFAFITIGNSKYDINTEALKLYGEDLNSVLLRFRKTSDYMYILKDKIVELKEQLWYVTDQVEYFCQDEMLAKILQILGVNATPVDELRSKMSAVSSGSERSDQRRTEISPVLLLELYPKLHAGLPASTINQYKTLGFEFAGRSIHTIIKHMGGDSHVRSTKLPFGGNYENDRSTPEHDNEHQVKQSSDIDPITNVNEAASTTLGTTLLQE